MENMKFLIPQPLVTMAGQLWAVKNADAWDLSNSTVETAARVFAYALTRVALAGAFFYALQRYKPDAKIASGVMALAVSAPATAMYWGGKCVIDGLKAIKDHVATPAFSKDFARSLLTKDVVVGAATYVLGLVILNFHNIIGYKGFKGGVEWFITKGMTLAKINGENY